MRLHSAMRVRDASAARKVERVFAPIPGAFEAVFETVDTAASVL